MKSSFQNRLPSTSKLAWLQVAFLTILLHGASAAQGPISAVQEALRREQVFFGEATGVVDEPTQEALKRFQVRQGLRVTGQIDSDTLQALEGSRDAGRPVVRSLPSKAEAEDQPTAVTLERDRAFLQSLQRAEARSQTMATPAPVASTELPPPPRAIEPSRGQGPLVANEPPLSPPPIVAEAPRALPTPVSRAQLVVVPASRNPESLVIAPGHRFTEVIEDPLDPRGGRVIRSTTTTIGPDGRTRIFESRTRTFANTPPPIIIRRAQPVEARSREGFFHRLFNKGGGHRDDNDDD